MIGAAVVMMFLLIECHNDCEPRDDLLQGFCKHAIAADANFAAAHRNLGVVLDLYLADPERALTELERYQELSGEEKPVSVWIAELRQRTGKKKPASPAPAAPADQAPPTPASPTPATPSGE